MYRQHSQERGGKKRPCHVVFQVNHTFPPQSELGNIVDRLRQLEKSLDILDSLVKVIDLEGEYPDIEDCFRQLGKIMGISDSSTKVIDL